jgi:hypothetical protein
MITRPFRLAVGVFALVAVAALQAAAQDEAALKKYFEGRRVVVRMDMPGTSDGVDVYADGTRAVDYQQYRQRLREYGAAIHGGEPATVTLVKVKKDLIEFQLGGGGFGTFSDDTSTSVYMPLVEKSRREKELEKKIDDEEDRRRRKEMERELYELRERRERENRRIEAAKALAEEHKRELIAQSRLHGGSRFNIRFEDRVPRDVSPADVTAALAEYVDFEGHGQPASARFSSPELLPRKGMTRDEAELELGSPIDVFDRREGRLTVTTLRFVAADQQITAEFVEDVLIRYAVSPR